jgi:hypothetical protein
LEGNSVAVGFRQPSSLHLGNLVTFVYTAVLADELVRHSSRTLSEEDVDDGYVFTCVASPGRDTDELVVDLTSTLNRYPGSID